MLALGQYGADDEDSPMLPPHIIKKLQYRRLAAKYHVPPHTILDWPDETVVFELEMLAYDNIAERAQYGASSGTQTTITNFSTDDAFDAYLQSEETSEEEDDDFEE